MITMGSRPITRDTVFAGLRVASGTSLIFYNLTVVLPQFYELFGRQSMVVPEFFAWYPYSPLFWLWDIPRSLEAAFIVMVLCLVAFTVGFYARYAHIVALVLVISFHHANPFVSHEPQLLSNLLLFLLLFVPIEQRWTLRVSPGFRAWAPASVRYERWVLTLLLGYLSLYYLFAGLKKLPDPMWRTGKALGALIRWPPLRVEGPLRDFLLSHASVTVFATYGALVFELAFVWVAFSRFRRKLMGVGIAFHMLVSSTLEVGHFAVAIIAWYPLLFVETRDLRPWRFQGGDVRLSP